VSSLPRLRLKKDLARHLRAGHPWIWRDALAPASLATGSIVDVHGPGGGFVARGLYDARSPIAVRVLALDPAVAVDESLVRARVSEALAARRGAFDPDDTDAFRLVNGEGDFLPGVVVDVYARVAVVRLDGEAPRALLPWVVEAVRETTAPLGVATVYERSRGGAGGLLAGDPPPVPVEIRECGVRFAVDVVHGQKTGGFLDQRDNRRAIRPFSDGEAVVNLFSYTGGFSVHAALAGAARVTSVDSAPAALDGARANFALNGLDPARHDFVCADAFRWIDEQRDRLRAGLVIVDPPSFAPSEKSLAHALAAYRELFAGALALVAPGGVLAASSCSSHVDLETFLGVLRDASAKARRPLRVLEARGQPPDHPTPPAFKEGRYLKFVLCRA